MPSFVQTLQPTPFGFFDSDPQFQQEADSMVTFVKRKLGDDVLSVELTRKEIWACFEEACCEYSRKIHELKIQSELANVLGMPTGSTNDLTNKYPFQTLEFLMRQASPYSTYAGVGGNYDATLGYFDLQAGKQDYNIYTDLKDAVSGSVIYQSMTTKSPIRVIEVFHVEPLAAQHFLLNASNVTNFLATNFNYESYVNSTLFYVLPIFEDVLRRGMLESAFRVRRSNYSYEILGGNVRIYPAPVTDLQVGKLFVKVQAGMLDPLNPTALQGQDQSIYGVSGPQNVPLGNIPFSSVTQPGRQWIRQYTLALSRELLGLIRSKFQNIPIPNADLQLNGENLISTAREDKEKLQTQLKEFLDNLTNAKLMEQQATMAEFMQKQLKYVPMPLGRSVIIG
jgi:hypothetical protein